MPKKKSSMNGGTDFVAQVVDDPTAPPQVLLLSGFPGESSVEGHARLYLDPELARWLEIPNDAILHSQEVPPHLSPFGGSYLWVDRHAELIQGGAAGPTPYVFHQVVPPYVFHQVTPPYVFHQVAPPSYPPSQPPQAPSPYVFHQASAPGYPQPSQASQAPPPYVFHQVSPPGYPPPPQQPPQPPPSQAPSPYVFHQVTYPGVVPEK